MNTDDCTKSVCLLALPSVGMLADGTEKRLRDMTEDELAEWRERLMQILGDTITEHLNHRFDK